MLALIIHLTLGLIVIVLIVRANPQIFGRPAGGAMFSPLELVYYAAGIAATVIGYYFNHQFVEQYPGNNAIWGQGSWQQFIVLGYDNPAASSASQDYTIMSLVLLPLFTIVDGHRRGIKRAWLYWTLVLFTSSAFPMAFYFATVERQHRHEKAGHQLDTVPA
jgi:Terpene cyclase DEP1